MIENIVGKDFLPRGTGIVTRAPLQIHLSNVLEEDKPKGEGVKEWATFGHKPKGHIYTDFMEVKKEIESRTLDLLTKDGVVSNGVAKTPILLSIFSPNVPDLVLVDLPGLTKLRLEGQDENLVKDIHSLVKSYTASPNKIILAVSPANQDIANSDSLKLAREVDPGHDRTIGVLTKVDLMDHGTDAADILSNRGYPLKLGHIGIISRSQQDIQRSKPIGQALEYEAEFFRTHPAYRSVSDKCGTPYLAKTLNRILMGHVREQLPSTKAHLTATLAELEQKLASFGDSSETSEENKGMVILQLMTKFATSFISSIDGTSSDISTKGLCGGALIYDIFYKNLTYWLESIDPTTNLSVKDIRNAIRNSTGPRPSLFVPELAFDLLVKPQIKLLEVPGQKCVAQVYQELISICHTCGSDELRRYPRLQSKLIEVVSDLLRERLGPCSSYVESLVAIQRAYINTNHPNFIGAAAAMNQVVSKKQETDRGKLIQDEREKRDRRRIREVGVVNGTDTPEDEEADKMDILPHRQKSRAPNGAAVTSRLNGHLATSSGDRGDKKSSSSPFAAGWAGAFQDTPAPSTAQRPSANPNLARHVSQSNEPNITQSIRSQEERALLTDLTKSDNQGAPVSTFHSITGT